MADAFIVTNVGLANAVSAAEQGIKLVLKSFRIGTAFGYTPSINDTGLHGSTLYSDQITTYRISAGGVLVVTCTLSVDSGPFQFGEIGIYTESGALFCLASLAAPLQKYSSLGTNIASTYSFDAYIHLGQATSVIVVDSVTSVTSSQVIGALGYTPYSSANPAGYITVSQITPYLADKNLQVWSLGVGTPPSGVLGEIRAVGNISTSGNIMGFQPSDMTLKENMERIPNPFQILEQLNGYFFDWRDDYLAAQGGESIWMPKHDVGFSAQEVEKALPVAAHRKEDGTLAITPQRLMPVILEGVKQIKNDLVMLRNENESLRAALYKLQARVDDLTQ